MWTAIHFRRQAAKCATLVKQTHDEECRQRYQRLEQMYLHLGSGPIKYLADQMIG